MPNTQTDDKLIDVKDARKLYNDLRGRIDANNTYDPSETYPQGTVGAELTSQYSRIAQLDSTKASKAALSETDYKATAALKWLEGIAYDVETDDDEAYSKTIKSGVVAPANKATVQMFGGKSVVWNQLLYFGDFTQVGYWVDPSGGTVFTVNNNILTGSVVTKTESNRLYSYTDTLGQNDHKFLLYVQIKTAEATSIKASSLGGSKKYGIQTTAANMWTELALLFDNDVSNSHIPQILYNELSVGSEIQFRKYLITDLSKTFGIGNEPTELTDPRIAAIEAYLADHPEYNAGEIISADCDEVDSTGFNLLNVDDIELGAILTSNGQKTTHDSLYRTKNYISVRGGEDYYFKLVPVSSSAYGVAWYDKDYAFISAFTHISGNLNKVVTAPINAAYMKATLGFIANKATWCINLSQTDTSINPHNGSVTPYMIPDSLLIPDRLREDYPLRSAGNAYDEYNVARKFTKVSVGDMYIGYGNWILQNGVFQLPEFDGSRNNNGTNLLCKLYTPVYKTIENLQDREMRAISAGLIIKNVDYNDVQSFKTSMSDVHLYYELATPIYYYDPTSPELAVNGGTVVPDDTHIVDAESYFPTSSYIDIESGGTVTFHQTDSEFPVPNSIAYMRKLSEVAS